jgi:hypothetical protein
LVPLWACLAAAQIDLYISAASCHLPAVSIAGKSENVTTLAPHTSIDLSFRTACAD